MVFAGANYVAAARKSGFTAPFHTPVIMDINKTIDGDTHELVVSGRVDGEGANQLEVALLATIAAGAKTVYVELADATFLCSAGLRTLLQYWRQMNNKQRTLQVTSPSPEVAAVLATSGFRDMLVRKM